MQELAKRRKVMNKILIALVLAVVMSGNVYANFITDAFKSDKSDKSEHQLCLEAVEKGKLISEYENNYNPEWTNKVYVYKGESYKFFYAVNKCEKLEVGLGVY